MKSRKLLIVDATGIVLTVGFLGVAAWCGVVDLPRHRASASRSAELLKTLDAEVRALGLSAAQSRQQVAALEEDIESRGALPSEVPVEAHLRLVDELAQTHGLELAQVNPLGRTEHDALSETRYEMQGQCRFEGLLAFLAAFEQGSLWADITDLRVAATSAPENRANSRRAVRFVISLYASETAPTLADGSS